MTVVDHRLAQLAKALRLMGGTHTVDDILSSIADGSMQSFAHEQSWVVTQIFNFPRKRVLEIFLAVGDLPDLLKLHDRIIDFAQQHDCQLVRAIGRKGWQMFVGEHEWQLGAQLYLKEID